MNKRDKATRYARAFKHRFKEFIELPDGIMRLQGTSHIKAEDYGCTLGGLIPYTNRYVKKVKQDLKRECRAAKRSDKQDVRKEVEKTLLEQE